MKITLSMLTFGTKKQPAKSPCSDLYWLVLSIPAFSWDSSFALGSTTSSVKYTASITRACSHNDLLLHKQSVTTGVNIPNLKQFPYTPK